jgi:hypothetical protein
MSANSSSASSACVRLGNLAAARLDSSLRPARPFCVRSDAKPRAALARSVMHTSAKAMPRVLRLSGQIEVSSRALAYELAARAATQTYAVFSKEKGA